MKPNHDVDQSPERRIEALNQIPVSFETTQRAVSKARDIVLGHGDASEPVAARFRLRDRIRSVIRHPLSLASTAAALAVAAIVGASLLSPPRLAMAQTAKAIREAKSYMLSDVFYLGDDPKSKDAKSGSTKRYWKAGGHWRWEVSDGKGQLLETAIRSSERPGIEINHEAKVYFEKPIFLEAMTPVTSIEKLGQYSAEADRDLGTRKIGETTARGYEINLQKIEPDFYKGVVQVWVDPQTDLPVEVHFTLAAKPWRPPLHWRLFDIRWNVDLDDQLFAPTPPAGYTKRTRSIPSLEERVEKICEAFRLYAKMLDGSYPQVARLNNAQIPAEQVAERYGIHPWSGRPQDTRRDEYVQIQTVSQGFSRLHQLYQSNPDIKYYGKSVGPKDGKKVLVRWRLEDGRYQVIYGDLRHEIVTVEQLRRLEGANAKTSSVHPQTEKLLPQPKRPHNRAPRTFGGTFDVAPTCHWKKFSYDTYNWRKQKRRGRPASAPLRVIEEGWFVPNVGMRIEVRDPNQRLKRVLVQNSRWRYDWDRQRNLVTVSHPGTDWPSLASNSLQIVSKRRIESTANRLKATQTSELEERDGATLEKVAYRYLADARDDYFSPIHALPDDFEVQIRAADAEFRMRTYWFDRESKMVRRRQCGCRSPKSSYSVDYPKAIPLELFAFQVPPDSTLRIEDRDLGRTVISTSSN